MLPVPHITLSLESRSTNQPLQAGKVFTCAKNANWSIKSPESRKEFTDNGFLSKKPFKVFDDHLIDVKVKFNPLHKKLFIEGIQQVHYVIINSLGRRFIADSFDLTGH